MHCKPADYSVIELTTKPDFDAAMQRIYAWYEQDIVDRPPVRFSAHNAEYSDAHHGNDRRWPDLKARWFDAEYQVDKFIRSIEGCTFHGETFPVFWPNLGPEVYSAFYGADLVYQEVTSYSLPLVRDWSRLDTLRLNRQSDYYKKLEEMTRIALEKCENRYLVGYTDIHPGVDCAAAWRDPQEFCMDLVLSPDEARRLIQIAYQDFQDIFDHFHDMARAQGHPSVTWMGIPSYGKLHLPSSDFSAMISPAHFEEFCLPGLQAEVKPMTHNIYHVDGKGVAKHLEYILSVPEINAIQWVQGMGLDMPIMQWVPLIQRIQAAGKSLVIDLQLDELEDFIAAVDKRGILLCIAAEESLQPDILKRVERW